MYVKLYIYIVNVHICILHAIMSADNCIVVVGIIMTITADIN